MQVRLVPDQVFPVATLPNAALGLGQAAGAAAFDTRNRARKPRLDQAPARSVIVVAGRQSPQAMQVLRQDHPGNCRGGPFEARAPEGGAKCPNVFQQQPVPSPLRQVHREEVCAADSTISQVGPRSEEHTYELTSLMRNS